MRLSATLKLLMAFRVERFRHGRGHAQKANGRQRQSRAHHRPSRICRASVACRPSRALRRLATGMTTGQCAAVGFHTCATSTATSARTDARARAFRHPLPELPQLDKRKGGARTSRRLWKSGSWRPTASTEVNLKRGRGLRLASMLSEGRRVTTRRPSRSIHSDFFRQMWLSG